MAWFARRGAQQPAPPTDIERLRAVHTRTKHHPQRYARGPHGLDWENQPDPFRRYEGAPLLALPLPAEPGVVAYERARVEGAVPAAALDVASLSALVFDSLALSAWKEAGGARWSLRVNPSSGNLHPTEAYVIAPAVPGLCESPAVLHYAPREHGLERLTEIPADLHRRLCQGLPEGALLVGLTSIDWREAWKYGERAFRYCNHDAGHALAAVALAAGGLGWQTRLLEAPSSKDLARLLGVHRQRGEEAERPEILLGIAPARSGWDTWTLDPATASSFEDLPWVGQASVLSGDHVEWDLIDLAREAADKPAGAPRSWTPPERGPLDPGAPQATGPVLRGLVRGRRSAVSMDGRTGLARAPFERMLARTLPRVGEAPLAALVDRPRLHLALFVHRVEEMEPGLYLLLRDPERLEALKQGLRPEFLWEPAAAEDSDLPLYLLLPRDLRGVAAQVCCNQAIAGDGAFSLGMLADFEVGLAEVGPWAYPRLYWESGAIGQVLYLESEALGVSSTGIGCFFDDAMHGLLGIGDLTWQSLYHFTVGGAQEDERLSTHPAYPGT